MYNRPSKERTRLPLPRRDEGAAVLPTLDSSHVCCICKKNLNRHNKARGETRRPLANSCTTDCTGIVNKKKVPQIDRCCNETKDQCLTDFERDRSYKSERTTNVSEPSRNNTKRITDCELETCPIKYPRERKTDKERKSKKSSDREGSNDAKQTQKMCGGEKSKKECSCDKNKPQPVHKRMKGDKCILEFTVQEKHAKNCPKRKKKRPKSKDNRVGPYDVIGRVIYPGCITPCNTTKTNPNQNPNYDDDDVDDDGIPYDYGQKTFSQLDDPHTANNNNQTRNYDSYGQQNYTYNAHEILNDSDNFAKNFAKNAKMFHKNATIASRNGADCSNNDGSTTATTRNVKSYSRNVTNFAQKEAHAMSFRCLECGMEGPLCENPNCEWCK